MHTAGIAGRPRRGCDPRILAAAGAIPDADAVVDGQVYGGAPRERVSACMLASLLRWARAEGLLAGQHDRMRDAPRAWFRKNVAHPTSYHLQGPDHAEWAIADLAQIINRLWGAPSGRPVRREIMMIAWMASAGQRHAGAGFGV